MNFKISFSPWRCALHYSPEYMARARALSFRILCLKAFSMCAKKFFRTTYRLQSWFSKTYATQAITLEAPTFKTPDIDFLASNTPLIAIAIQNAMDHKFDLLGSGLISVGYGISVKGLKGHIYSSMAPSESDVRLGLHINRSNCEHAKKLLSALPSDYQMIDWQLDFKSGFRWEASTWWEDILYGHKLGVDIKVPWELSRMQHLPLLAYGYQRAKVGIVNEDPQKYGEELQWQILDFIGTNPPGFGVNWRCPMDIAIRGANWTMALDLFRSAGYEFPSEFLKTLASSLFDHGKFIERNFEIAPDFRSNHYLANISGLTFIAHGLKPDPTGTVQRWRNFCTPELIKEAEHQFHSIGTNFEGSSFYHRLSAELLFYPILLLHIRAQGQNTSLPFSNTFYRKLLGMAAFTADLTKPDGNMVQVGDNDSGRFFKLAPAFLDASYPPKENPMDALHLPRAIHTFFGATASDLESSIIANSLSLPAAKPQKPSVHKDILTIENTCPPPSAEPHSTKTYRFSMPPDYRAQMIYSHYKDFGIVIYKGPDFFLSFRCGPIGQNGRGGHDHDDQLSMELYAGGRTHIVDPGTFLYTALPEQRNLYRSSAVHFRPQIVSPSTVDLNKGLFFLSGAKPGTVISLNEDGCSGLFEGYGFPIIRKIRFEEKLVIEDYFYGECEPIDLNQRTLAPYSPGYGLQVHSKNDLFRGP